MVWLSVFQKTFYRNMILWTRYQRIKRTNPNPSPTGTIGERKGTDLSQIGGELHPYTINPQHD